MISNGIALTALYVARKRIEELICKTDTSNREEVMLLLRDKMTMDEAIKELEGRE